MSACHQTTSIKQTSEWEKNKGKRQRSCYWGDECWLSALSSPTQQLNDSPTHWLTDWSAVALFALSVTLFSEEEWGFGAFSIDEIFHKFDSRLPYNIHFQIFFFIWDWNVLSLILIFFIKKKNLLQLLKRKWAECGWLQWRRIHEAPVPSVTSQRGKFLELRVLSLIFWKMEPAKGAKDGRPLPSCAIGRPLPSCAVCSEAQRWRALHVNFNSFQMMSRRLWGNSGLPCTCIYPLF